MNRYEWPASMANGGDILCPCGNRPDLDGFVGTENDPWAIEVYVCASCGAEHNYAELERERENLPWRAAILERLHLDEPTDYELERVAELFRPVFEAIEARR